MSEPLDRILREEELLRILGLRGIKLPKRPPHFPGRLPTMTEFRQGYQDIEGFGRYYLGDGTEKDDA